MNQHTCVYNIKLSLLSKTQSNINVDESYTLIGLPDREMVTNFVEHMRGAYDLSDEFIYGGENTDRVNDQEVVTHLYYNEDFEIRIEARNSPLLSINDVRTIAGVLKR